MEMNPSLVAGVFRNQADADRAIQELKQVGFQEDQIQATPYNMQIEGIPETSRLVVTILAGDRNQEAAAIFVKNGANNADLPAGMVLDEHGSLVNAAPTLISDTSEPDSTASA